MKFTPRVLIASIDNALAADDKARAELDVTVATIHRDHAASWTKTLAPEWRKYRDQLTVLLKTGKPITHKNLPTRPNEFRVGTDSWPVEEAISKARRENPVMHEADRAELVALRATLDAVLDEQISDTQLGRLGFGAKSIAKVFRAATIGGAK